MGLEPTTLPLEVAPSAHDFVRLVQVQGYNLSQVSEAGQSPTSRRSSLRWLMGLEPTTTWTTTRGSTN